MMRGKRFTAKNFRVLLSPFSPMRGNPNCSTANHANHRKSAFSEPFGERNCPVGERIRRSRELSERMGERIRPVGERI